MLMNKITLVLILTLLTGMRAFCSDTKAYLDLKLVLHNKTRGHPYQLGKIVKVYTGVSSRLAGKLNLSDKAPGIRIYQGKICLPEGTYHSLFLKYQVGYYSKARITYGKIFNCNIDLKSSKRKSITLYYYIDEDSNEIDRAFLDRKIDVHKLNDPFYTGESTKSKYNKGWSLNLSNTKF